MRNQTSHLRILRSDALPLSHRDSTVSEVYYEIHMTRVGGSTEFEGLRFGSSWGLRVFSLSHARDKTKKRLSLFL